MKTQLRKEAAINPRQAQPRSNNDNLNKPAVFMLSVDGMILDADKEGTRLLDYSPNHSNKFHISKVIPQLAEIGLLEEGERVNTYLRFLSRIGHRFDVTGLNGTQFSGELYFNDIKTFDQHHIIVMIYPVHYKNKVSLSLT